MTDSEKRFRSGSIVNAAREYKEAYRLLELLNKEVNRLEDSLTYYRKASRDAVENVHNAEHRMNQVALEVGEEE